MPFYTYQLSTERDVEERLRKRFRAELAAFREIGFEEFYVCEELTSFWGSLLSIVILPSMLFRRQVLKIKKFLRLAIYDPILISRERATCAKVTPLGITFYTNFADDALLISKHSELDLHDLADEKVIYYHRPVAGVEQAWAFHQARMNEFIAEGKQPREGLSFEDYLETNKRGEVAIGKAMVSGILDKQEDARKLSPKLTMLTRASVVCVTAMNVVALAFVAPGLYSLLEANFYLGVGVILAIVVVLLNLLAASWDALRLQTFDIRENFFYIPKTAVWANRIKNFLFGCFVVVLMLSAFKVLPLYLYIGAAAIWFVYESSVSLFFRLRKRDI